MSRLLPLLLALPLSGCSAVCSFIGDYQGTFTGDASGNFELNIEDGGKDADPIATATFGGDLDGAVATGTIGCEDGELTLEIYLDDESFGSFEGALDEATGEGTWHTDDGQSGTWNLE